MIGLVAHLTYCLFLLIICYTAMTTVKEHLLMWPALIILTVAMFALLYGVNTQMGRGPAMYNCSIAEISPDFTPAMREECRKLRK